MILNILGVVAVVVAIGGSFLASVLALTKGFETINKLMEGDVKNG